MSEKDNILAEANLAEAAHIASVAKEAEHKALASTMIVLLDEYFRRGQAEKRFVDVGRIPFICDDIRGLHQESKETKESVNEIKEAFKEMRQNSVTKDDFSLIRNIVFGFISLIVTGFMGSLMFLVFK